MASRSYAGSPPIQFSPDHHTLLTDSSPHPRRMVSRSTSLAQNVLEPTESRTRKYLEGFYVDGPHIAGKSVTLMLTCNECVLFRSKRASNDPCGCGHNIGKIMYRLDVDDLQVTDYSSPGSQTTLSGFQSYRNALQEQLGSNETFFRRRAKEIFQFPFVGGGLPSYGHYIRILINIVPHGAEQGDLKVNTAVEVLPLKPIPGEEFESDPYLVRSIIHWRTSLEGRTNGTFTGIGIALKVVVHYPSGVRVRFEVWRGLQFTVSEVAGFIPRLSWWQMKISNRLGDYPMPYPNYMLTLKYLVSLDAHTASQIDFSCLPREHIRRLQTFLLMLERKNSALLERLFTTDPPVV